MLVFRNYGWYILYSLDGEIIPGFLESPPPDPSFNLNTLVRLIMAG